MPGRTDAKKSPAYAAGPGLNILLLAYNYLAESAGAATAAVSTTAAVSIAGAAVSTPVLIALSIAVESPEPEVPALLQAATNRPRASARKPNFFMLNVFKVYLK